MIPPADQPSDPVPPTRPVLRPSRCDLPTAWLIAARNPTIRAELEHIYTDLATEITRRGPACWASGRCCNFEKAGHRLYVTGLEAAYTIASLNPAAGHPELSSTSLSLAQTRGGCPFQVNNLCGIHAIKPLGCRVYFCDRSAQAWQQDLTEQMLERIRAIHDQHAIEYRYGEWRQMLAMFTADSSPAR